MLAKHYSSSFIAQRNERIDAGEAKQCGDTNLAIDFYFPEEATAVEIAGMLGAPNSE